MEAIILVGGLGTRLGVLTKDTPKPMLPIRGVPFIDRLLRYLFAEGITRVVLAIGYKKEIIDSYFNGLAGNGLPEIVYSEEDCPLGTGGAILKALPLIKGSEVFIMNGDSYLQVNYYAMHQFYMDSSSGLVLASYYVDKADRYGVICVNKDSRIVSFEEKGSMSKGLINGGVYLSNKVKLLKKLLTIEDESFSFEECVLSVSKVIADFNMKHFETTGYFLDIGIPEDYERAQKELFIG